MLRRHVLAALAAGVEAGDDDVARRALADIDWVLRGAARRRLEQALLEAAVATGETSYEDTEAVRHVLRAAALIVREQREELSDRARVAAAYGASAMAAPFKMPLATIVAGVLAAATATTLSAATVMAIKGPRADVYVRPAPPPPVGVYRDGGVPKRDAEIERVLASDLPAMLASSLPPSPQETARLRDHHAFLRHGAGLALAWRDMVMSLERWAMAVPYDREGAERELRERLYVVSDQLAAAELGYYLDPTLVNDSANERPFAYRIEDVGFVRANDAKVRVLGARQLDAFSSGARKLGVTLDEIDDPVVLMNTVEEKVAWQILPVLGGRAFPLANDSWAYSVNARTAAGAASEAIRRELLAALYTDAADAQKAAVKCKELVVTSVRHHEAQHVLDQERGLAHPAELAQLLPDKKNDPFSVRARFELSAWTSQIASDTWLPQLTLWNLARHGFRNTPGRRAESYVAVVVIEGLARKLGIESPGPVIHRGAVDRDRLARLVTPLARRTTVELRSAAAALWKDLFGTPLVRLYE
ncbi:MAG: hypothetical protein SFX73_24720 [Kofleriaceae bacterium]|nr:hypothetical protein [Kofleriaceae bacterium]